MAAERPRRRHPWRRRILFVLLITALAVIGLGVLALPFRGVQDDAEAARTHLEVAADALRAGEVGTARERVESARAHVDRALGATHGVGGDLWQWVPVAGGGIRDVRHLVSALADATAIAEVGVDVYPRVLGEEAAGLVQDATVDMEALESVVASLHDAGEHARSARAHLDEVDGDAPMVGPRVREARDAALAEVVPLVRSYDRAEPLLDVLPGLLGGDRERNYLVAILNPAELRYSGGATLALATVRMDDGRATFDDVGNLDGAPATNRPLYWKKVPGNPFHERGATRIHNATWSPYWSTSGEELLRAWAKVDQLEYDGVLAIDVPAIASLLTITGPVDAGDYGTLDEHNLTETLVGSYDIYTDIFERRALNAMLIPIFREKLFEGGRFTDKFEVLGDAAAARQFAMYLRDEGAQRVVADLGLSGDLSDTGHDYLGVFTQNTNRSKVDYWQERSVTSDVTLEPDGSARVTLKVTVHNATTPYPFTGRFDNPDPGAGYWTRVSEPSIGVFLPKDVEVIGARVDGEPADPFVDHVGERPFVRRTLHLQHDETGTMEVTYRVPRAAVTTGDTGDGLTYRLDVDPQAMVNPEAVSVTVHLPRGYAVRSLPPGWSRAGRGTVTWSVDGLVESPRFEISAVRRG
jgi:hypothetical protein